MESFYAKHEDRIRFVSNSTWSDIRREATVLLKQSGLATLESAAALVAEAEFRDRIPAEDDFPSHVWERLRRAGSKLAWLPPRRLEIEKRIPMWELRPDGTGGYGHTGAEDFNKRAAITDDSPARLTPVPDEAPYALAAFEAMMQQSNGEAEAWRGVSETPLKASRGVVREICSKFGPLADARAGATAVAISPEEAVHVLLRAAVSESAYGCGGGAAYGRYGAWRTIAFLVAAHVDAEFAEVSQRAAAAAWVQLAARTPWFDDAFWSGCMACIDPAQTTVSVVAWADSD